MADAVLAKALFVRLEFDEDAAGYLTTTEKLNDANKIRVLTPDRVSAIVKALRRPGGTSDGYAVAEAAHYNFELAVYYIQYLERTSRNIRLQDVTLDKFPIIERHRDLVNKWDNADYAAPVFTESDIKKSVDDVWEIVDETLSNIRGCIDVPISYCTRENMIPKPSAADPAEGYTTIDLELIARVRIVKQGTVIPADLSELEESVTDKCGHYKTDNIKVHETLFKMLGKTSLWIHAKVAAKKKHGRLAYKRMYVNTFGRHAMDIREKTCRAAIVKLTYTGPKRGFTFNDYVGRHKEQHAIKASLVTHGYNDFTEPEKVGYLTDGIKTSTLDVAVNAVLGDDAKRNNFEAASTHLADFVRFTLERERSNNRNISQVGTGRGGAGRGGGGRGRGGGRGSMKDRDAEAMKLTHIDKTYYPDAEYKKLNGLEKHKVYLNQKAQKENGEWLPAKGGRKASVAELSSQVSELQSAVKSQGAVLAKTRDALKRKTDDESSDSRDDDHDIDNGSNRSNEALCRQASTGKKSKKH